MKKTYYSLILSIMLLAFPTMINTGHAQTTRIFMDPSDVQNITVGNTFKINLNVSDVQNLFAWQTTVQFDPTILACQKSEYPASGYIFAGKNQVPVTPNIDNTTGKVTSAASLLGMDSAAGSGILNVLTFQVLVVGSTAINFSSPYGEDTALLDGDLNVIPATVTNGHFTNAPLPPQERHDVAVTSLSFSNSNPKQGENITISVDVLNNGTFAETFNLQVSYDTGNVIGTQAVTSLAASQSQTLAFTWNTSVASIGTHTITANVTNVPVDADLTNNAQSKTLKVVSSTGPNTDLNGDGKVDIKDVYVVGIAFGTEPGDKRWDPIADVNGDGVVNIMDAAIVTKDFGKGIV